jgi:hypothetical protein
LLHYLCNLSILQSFYNKAQISGTYDGPASWRLDNVRWHLARDSFVAAAAKHLMDTDSLGTECQQPASCCAGIIKKSVIGC